MINRKSLFCLILLLFSIILGGCSINNSDKQQAQGYTVVDYSGHKTFFKTKPQRVLCYNLTYDTMLLGIVPPKYLVAKSYIDKDKQISYIVEETKAIKNEFRLFKALNIEAIMKMAPELIIVPETVDANVIRSYRDLGIAVVVCKGPYNIADIKMDIKLMAKAMGEEAAGEKVVAEMDRQLEEITAKIKTPEKDRPSVMLMSRMRQYGGIGSVFDDICKKAGVRNAISMMGIRHGETVTREAIISSDPDIFLIAEPREFEEKADEEFRRNFIGDKAFKHLKGMKHHITLPNRYLYSNSQNCVYAIKGIYNYVYGPTFDIKGEKLIKGY